MAYDAPVEIGELRWRVSLASRTETADPNSVMLVEDYRRIAEVWAAIRPSRQISFVGGEQVEGPATHEIVFRWLPYHALGGFEVILRDQRLPDGARRWEVYRLRNVREDQGRQRFVICECELEATI